MYQYNEDVNIHTPYGYNNGANTRQPNLFCGDNFHYIYTENYDNSSLAFQSLGTELPCSSLTFHCNNFSVTNDNSCEMLQQFVDDTSFFAAGGSELWECYPTLITDLYTNQCSGSCPSSPTSAPTKSPTKDPTAQTTDPTTAPTETPTDQPTPAPTKSPTEVTANPSMTPTVAPSLAPSQTPSIAPTFLPTLAPTQFPTAGGRFKWFIRIIYEMGGLTSEIMKQIAAQKSVVIPIIQELIERGYYLAANDQFLSYADFEVIINKINGNQVGDINDNSWLFWKETEPLLLECHINCLYDQCVFIANQDMNKHSNDVSRRLFLNIGSPECDDYDLFQPKTECNLQRYFNHTSLSFKVENPESFSSESVECIDGCIDEDQSYVLYIIMGFLGLMTFISILAFLYNKKLFCTLPGFSPVDSAQWTSWIIFGIQGWDFISDINLAIEISGDLNGNGIPDGSDKEEDYDGLKDANILMLIAAVGSSLSIIIPYIVNLGIAANIKRLIRRNNAAKAYFQNYAAVYVIFVVLSGGAYPALAIVSSNIFGLAIFNSGLTKYEMKRLSKIKIFGTIILENLPQLACQILYAYVLGGITPTTQLAFIASILSMTSSTLSYFVEQNAADTIAVQYYLCFQCAHTERTGAFSTNKTSIVSPYDGDKKGGSEDFEAITNDNTNHKLGLTQDEKNMIWSKKGLKSKLSTAIGEVFGISSQNIEIGYTQITKYGIITHFVHYVYESDLEEQKLDAPSFTEQLYGIAIKEITVDLNH